MALLNGKATFIKFRAFPPSGDYLPGINPEITGDFFSGQIPKYKFVDIDDTYDEYSVGWVSVADNLDAEFTGMYPVFGSRFVVLTMRVDQRKIQTAILNKLLAKAFKEEMDQRQVPKLPRSLKAQIKERVRTQLMRKAIPAPTVVDVYYDIELGKGLFFSTNRVAFSVFEDLFRECFGLLVNQEVPFIVGGDDVAELYPHLSGSNVCMADIIDESRPLGQEFLRWLWWISETTASVETEQYGPVSIVVGNNIKLESTNEKISCTGPQSDLHEAKTGLNYGKQVDQVGFLISCEGSQYTGSINSMFEFRSVAAPNIGDSESTEDLGGIVLARAQQFIELIGMVHAIFHEFLKARLDAVEWMESKDNISAWLARSQEQ